MSPKVHRTVMRLTLMATLLGAIAAAVVSGNGDWLMVGLVAAFFVFLLFQFAVAARCPTCGQNAYRTLLGPIPPKGSTRRNPPGTYYFCGACRHWTRVPSGSAAENRKGQEETQLGALSIGE